MAKSQVELNREYRERLTTEEKKERNVAKRFSNLKSFIRYHATVDELLELEQLIEDTVEKRTIKTQ